MAPALIACRASQEVDTAIVIDGVFLQLFNTGIARGSKKILMRWQKSDIGRRLILLQ